MNSINCNIFTKMFIKDLYKIKQLLLLLFLPFAKLYSQETFSLKDCIEYALTHNREINIYCLQVDRSELEEKNQKHQFLPTVSYIVNNYWTYPYQDESNAYHYSLNAKDYSNEAFINFSVPISSSKAQLSNVKIAQINTEISRLQLQERKLQLKMEVTDMYYKWILSSIRYQINLKKLELQDSILSVTRNMFKLGKKAHRDVLLAELNLSQDVLDVQQEKNNMDLAMINLKNIMNCDNQFQIFYDDLFLDSLKGDEFYLYKRENENYPAIKVGKMKIESSKYQIKNAKRYFFPSVYLSYELGTSGQKCYMDEYEQNFPSQWKTNLGQQIVLNFQYDIFNKLSVKNKLKQLNIETNKLEDQINIEKENIKENLTVLFIQITQLIEQITLLKKNVLLSEKQYKLAVEDYKLGFLASYELNEYQNRYISLSLQLMQIQCEIQHKKSIFQLYLE